jgi:DNA topoisomerase-1
VLYQHRQEQPYTLVICEKPAAALRIAEALGTANLKILRLDIQTREKTKGLQTPVFHATDVNGTKFLICSAIGHLYGLVDRRNNRDIYPVFDVKWVPIVRKKGALDTKKATAAKQIISTIAMLSLKASRFIHACDYDQEGELIGYNILQYACENRYEKSMRAKFSTLTDEEIRKSFDNLFKPRAMLAEAGKTRHIIDFIYGINLSRALTQSFKVSNLGKKYYNLSIGRVQGPTLAFVVDREMEIRTHIPVPYWDIQAEFENNGQIIEFQYHKHRLRSLSEALSIVQACENQSGKVIEATSTTTPFKAPAPFNLGDLQKEAYRLFKFSPNYTLTIAEKLYLSALICYPRTSSQKLPPSINYKKIISDLSELCLNVPFHRNEGLVYEGNHSTYKNLAASLLCEGPLSPNEGNKTDPAHPAIYPTGQKPKGKLDIADVQLFDLIIKRFFATFGKPALIKLTTITIQVKDKYLFRTNSRKTIHEGWLLYYTPYVIVTNTDTKREIMDLHIGHALKNINIKMVEKFSQAPPRFNQATLLEQMEKDNIGTKATRSDIISTLFKRNYISNISTPQVRKANDQQKRSPSVGIEATDIGFEIIQSMRNYVPEVVSKDLTRFTDAQLDRIEAGKIRSTAVLEGAVHKLNETLLSFKQNEIDIGRQISDAITITRMRQQRQTILGSCPVCIVGQLKVIWSSRTKKRFAGCSNYVYAKCKATAPLPQSGSLRTIGKSCPICRWPIVKATYFHRNRSWKFCINIQCPAKKAD